MHAAFLVWLALAADAQAASQLFRTPLAPEEMADKQAVVETTFGTFVLALLPDAAPNHVGYFLKLAPEGAYGGTTFHRAVRRGIIQGGDPLSKDPDTPELYGRGGLGVLAREPNDERHTRGAVSAVLQPGNPDSAGSQFFVCVVDQPALDGQYTVFASVVDRVERVPRDGETPVARVELRRVRVERGR